MQQTSPQQRPAVRYIDNPEMQRALEAQKREEMAAKRRASLFLAQGPGQRTGQPAPARPAVKYLVPKTEVERATAQKLSAEADKAARHIRDTLTPLGVQVYRGDRDIKRPFAEQHLVHLCEATVCHIPYKTKEGATGRLVIKMTNFDSGVAVPTKNGILYKDVKPKKDTADERPSFRVLGVRTNESGEIIGIDPAFTAKGLAWNTRNVDAITAACMKSLGVRPEPVQATPKARSAPQATRAARRPIEARQASPQAPAFRP